MFEVERHRHGAPHDVHRRNAQPVTTERRRTRRHFEARAGAIIGRAASRRDRDHALDACDSPVQPHRERLRTVDDAERALPGLRFCANYRGGVAVGDCIKSAHATTEAVMRYLKGAEPPG